MLIKPALFLPMEKNAMLKHILNHSSMLFTCPLFSCHGCWPAHALEHITSLCKHYVTFLWPTFSLNNYSLNSQEKCIIICMGSTIALILHWFTVTHLLPTWMPVHWLIREIIQSANHVGAKYQNKYQNRGENVTSVTLVWMLVPDGLVWAFLYSLHKLVLKNGNSLTRNTRERSEEDG